MLLEFKDKMDLLSNCTHSLQNTYIKFYFDETSAQGWCTGKTQRDGMGRGVGEGIRMGNTCKSMADSCQCMAKTTTIL